MFVNNFFLFLNLCFLLFTEFVNIFYHFDNYEVVIGYYLKNVILNCGPIAIKIFQCLSSRNDIFHDTIRSILSSLTDNVIYAYDNNSYFIDKLSSSGFDSTNCTKIGSGTIAIVYLTKVSNVSVVIKIKRPNIEAEITRSFRLVYFLCMIYDFFGSLDIVEKLNKLKTSLLKQTDFANELNNLEYFFEMYNNSNDIIIPQPFRQYCSSDIITMSYIEGIRIDDLSIDKKKKIGQSLWKFAFNSCFIHGKYHSDLHTGNLLLTPDNKIGVLDYGLTGKLFGFSKCILFNYHAHIFKHEWHMAARLFVTKMVVCPPVFCNLDCFISDVEVILCDCFSQNVPKLYDSIFKLELCCKKNLTQFNNNYCDFELAFSTLISTLSGLECDNFFGFAC